MIDGPDSARQVTPPLQHEAFGAFGRGFESLLGNQRPSCGPATRLNSAQEAAVETAWRRYVAAVEETRNALEGVIPPRLVPGARGVEQADNGIAAGELHRLGQNFSEMAPVTVAL